MDHLSFSSFSFQLLRDPLLRLWGWIDRQLWKINLEYKLKLLTCLIIKEYGTCLKTNQNIDILFESCNYLAISSYFEATLRKFYHIINLWNLLFCLNLTIEIQRSHLHHFRKNFGKYTIVMVESYTVMWTLISMRSSSLEFSCGKMRATSETLVI